jgi:hypothetical protein
MNKDILQRIDNETLFESEDLASQILKKITGEGLKGSFSNENKHSEEGDRSPYTILYISVSLPDIVEKKE